MSPADAMVASEPPDTAVPPAEPLPDEPPCAPAARAWSARFVRSELAMVFRRRRNLAMLGVLAAVPVLIAVAVRVTDGRPRHGDGSGTGPALFNSITDNGIFVALAAMLVIQTLFLPMATAVVSGESVAGEAHTGTLRYLLAVPVSRTRLLAVKFTAVLAWCLACALTVAIAGVAIGLILFPSGDVTLLSGTTASFADGLYRLLLVVCYVTVMIAAVGAIGLFVSTLTEVPIAAMATTLVVAIASQVMDAVPQLSSIHSWLFSHYWLYFSDLLRDPIATNRIDQGLAVSVAYAALFLALAWAHFSNKDVSS
ncbi:MAG: ABC transporter permease [Actinomycetia bacterium]|nr:ABC transporter permease [Actinomycetes bacterium]